MFRTVGGWLRQDRTFVDIVITLEIQTLSAPSTPDLRKERWNVTVMLRSKVRIGRPGAYISIRWHSAPYLRRTSRAAPTSARRPGRRIARDRDARAPARPSAFCPHLAPASSPAGRWLKRRKLWTIRMGTITGMRASNRKTQTLGTGAFEHVAKLPPAHHRQGFNVISRLDERAWKGAIKMMTCRVLP